MHRFFVLEENILENTIKIVGTDVNHIKNVLRLSIEDKVEVIGSKYNYDCEISHISKDEILLLIKEEKDKTNESNLRISLFQGLPKSSKMETIIQKCTELGVYNFYPVSTNRSVVKINDMKKEEKKVQRWQLIAEEASKQSKRDIIPKVENILGFNDMMEKIKDKVVIVPYESEEKLSIKGLKTSLENVDEINIIIGPEGGFEEYEIEKLKNSGAHIVTLGPRILRTETAGVVTATILMYEFGDLGVIK